jgi:hypothetical protein
MRCAARVKDLSKKMSKACLAKTERHDAIKLVVPTQPTESALSENPQRRCAANGSRAPRPAQGRGMYKFAAQQE